MCESSITGFSDWVKLKTGTRSKENPRLFSLNKAYVLFFRSLFPFNYRIRLFSSQNFKTNCWIPAA